MSETAIPVDKDARDRLAKFAGLSDDEMHALDLWCFQQANERAAERRRAWEKSANWVMP